MFSSMFALAGGGYPIFPPLLLEEPLLQMRLQHAFLLLLSLDGQAKVLDLAERRCLCRASLKDLCEPSLLQLDDALQMSFLDFGRVFWGGTFMIRCFHVCCWIVDGILI